MTNANVTTASKITFRAEDRQYRYVLTPAQGLKHAVLKILVNKKLMDKFRNSAVGREVGHMVDIFEQGGGWYEITDSDFYAARMLRRGYKDFASGIKTWLRNFNLSNLPAVTRHEVVAAAPAAVHSPSPKHDAASIKAPVPAPRPIVDEHLLNMASKLAGRFGKTLVLL